MKLYGLRLFVDDYQAARHFYLETLGLSLAWEMAEHGALGVSIGGPQFIIEAVDAESSDEDKALVGRFIGVSLQVENIQETYADLLAKGVVFTAPPEQQFWGGSLAHFKDPAGNVLTLLG